MQACTRRIALGVLTLCATGCVGEVGEPTALAWQPNPVGGLFDAGPGGAADGSLPGNDMLGGRDSSVGVGEPDPVGGGADATVDSPPTPIDPCADREPLARGLRIEQLALYQAVKIPLMEGGSWVAERLAPVVQGKRALLRVFVTPDQSYVPRDVLARLTLTNAGISEQLEQTARPAGASTDESLSSTFNFELEPADVGSDTELSVALLEKDCTDSPVGDAKARYPAAGAQALEAEAMGKLRVVLVPVENGGFVPDTGPSQLSNIRERLLALYPVAEVELTVDDVLSWPYPVSADAGWTDLLNEIMNERARDRPERDVYYYGLVTPSRDIQSYCGWGCALGIAPAPTSVSPDHQVGLGIGYAVDETYGTIAHELGHAHGRYHAPTSTACGPQPADVDRWFPDTEGRIDIWGWDSTTKTLVEPSAYDMMGYCDPIWVSAYTYEAIANRSFLVNTSFKRSAGTESEWSGIVLYADGTARWTSAAHGELGGDQSIAQVLDEAGALLTETRLTTVALSHSADALLYIEELPEQWASLVLPTRTLLRSDIMPALAP